MVVGFNEWATAAEITQRVTLEDLRNYRLGIEAEDYINNLLSNPPTREPLLPALGGLPFSLEVTIKNHLSVLEEHSIQPYFVFNGLNYNGQQDKLQAMLKAAKTINNAWEQYGLSQPENAVNEFGTLCKHYERNLLYRVFQTLESNQFYQAPLTQTISIASCRQSSESEVFHSSLHRTVLLPR